VHAGGDGEPRRLMARTPFVTQPVSTLHHRSAHRGPATISGENCETPCGPAGSCSAAASATAVPGCSTGAAVGCVGLDERLFERPPPVRVHRPPGPSTGRSVLFRHAHCSGDGPATRPDPDVALTGASEAVFDWEGGTRIGESIHTFNRTLGGRPDTGAQRWSSVATGWSGEAHNRSQARWPGCGDDLGGSFWEPRIRWLSATPTRSSRRSDHTSTTLFRATTQPRWRSWQSCYGSRSDPASGGSSEARNSAT
jgi:hypothetical protein